MTALDIDIATAVWGDWHLGIFLDVNLPTLLEPGNLPVLARQHRPHYRIQTRVADVPRIRASPSFERLSALMPVDLEIIPDRDLEDPIAAHVAAWRESIDAARKAGRFIVLMPPDVLWSAGSLGHVSAMLQVGKRAIFVPFLRVTSNGFLPDFRSRYGGGDGPIAIPGQELVGFCFDHIHPLMGAYLRDSRYFPSHAEMVLWAVEGEGLSVRSLARELFAFDTGAISLSPAQLIEDPMDPALLHMPADSDLLFGVSLAPLGKDARWHLSAWQLVSLDLAQWWLTYDSPVNDYVAGIRLRWHERPISEAVWRVREMAGDLLIRRAAIEREGLRLVAWMGADEHADQLLQVSQLASLVVLNGVLARALRGLPRTRGTEVVVCLPEDAALDSVWITVWPRLLSSAGRGLERFLRDHVGIAQAPVSCDGGSSEPIEIAFLGGVRRTLRWSGERGQLDAVAVGRRARLSESLVVLQVGSILSEPALAAAIAAEAPSPAASSSSAQHVIPEAR